MEAGWTVCSSPEVVQSPSPFAQASSVVLGAPACCPLLGSDHFLCVAHTIPLPVSPTRCEHRPLLPLRDWKPTLPRAHQVLLQWSSRLGAMLLEPLPRETDRSSTVDDIFVSLITILRTHAPSQRQHPRRGQLAWWTPECFEAGVVRNGAWRDFRRTQDPRDRSRSCAARVHVHRTVRSCQTSFWSQWQDSVSNLSCGNPRCPCSSPHIPPRAVQKGPDALCPLASRGGSIAAVAAALHVRLSSIFEVL